MLLQILTIVVKITAILIFINSIYLLADNYFFIHQYLQKSQLIPSIYIVYLTIPFVLSIIIWFFSLAIAKLLMPKIQDSKPLSERSLSEIQTAVFSIIGLALLVFTAQDLISWLMWLGKFNPNIHSEPKFFGIATIVFVNIVLGIWLLLGAKGLLGVIHKFRYAGYNK